MTSLVKHLNVALGVHTLLAYHGLVVLLGSGSLAKDELRKLRSGPGDIDYRVRVGRNWLEARTAFISEDQVKQWANNKYAQLQNPEMAPDFADLRDRLLERETEAVRLVFLAYQRAQIVLAAFNDATNMDDREANAALDAAFNHAGTHVLPDEAMQIAIFADVNPCELWLQYGYGWAETFEFARFVGRVNAGLEATISADQFAVAKRIIATQSDDDPLSGLWIDLRELICRHFAIERFHRAVQMAAVTNGTLRVSRAMRILSVETPKGQRHVIESR